MCTCIYGHKTLRALCAVLSASLISMLCSEFYGGGPLPDLDFFIHFGNFERDFVDIDLHALWGSCLCCFNPIWLPFLGESAPLGKLKIEMD